jgi:uncharacterized protein (DUF2249 family)/quercetin dioxygenase-like cupin family protein
MTEIEVDVRSLPKPQKHPTIFGVFGELDVNASLILVNNHDPRHLRDEFATEFPDGFDWDYLERGPAEWRIRITKLASTSLPRVLLDTGVLAGLGEDISGAVWKLQMAERDLDANVVNLPPRQSIGRHQGPDLDVLILVLYGGGTLETERGDVAIAAGELVWLPKRSQRAFTAGAAGLQYLTVHPRRTNLLLQAA